MARKKTRKRRPSREEVIEARLELIKTRHRKLILMPRELIAADLDSEFDDGLDEAAEAEELQLAEVVQGERL